MGSARKDNWILPWFVIKYCIAFVAKHARAKEEQLSRVLRISGASEGILDDKRAAKIAQVSNGCACQDCSVGKSAYKALRHRLPMDLWDSEQLLSQFSCSRPSTDFSNRAIEFSSNIAGELRGTH